MKFFKYLLSSFLLIHLATLDVTSHADQNDPRLSKLFAQLSLSPENSSKKIQIEREIWAIWMVHDDPYSQYLLRKGSAEMSTGNLAAAKTSFTNLITLAPEFAEAWNKRATLHFIQNQHENSISDIRQTLLLEPRHFGAIAGLGLNLEAIGEREAAISAYNEALIINPHMKQIKEKLKALKQTIIDEQI